MTWNRANVTGALFQAVISPGVVDPLVESLPIALPLNFSQVDNINVFGGNYTPNNDYRYIFQNLGAALAPNFMIITCDAQLSLSEVRSTSTHVRSYSRFNFLSWVADPVDFLATMYIEGRTNIYSPMPQGALVNYVIITGQAVIS